MKMCDNPTKYEVLIQQYLRSILDISGQVLTGIVAYSSLKLERNNFSTPKGRVYGNIERSLSKNKLFIIFYIFKRNSPGYENPIVLEYEAQAYSLVKTMLHQIDQ